MFEIMAEKLKNIEGNANKYNYLREYLQLLILRILDEKGYFRQLAFVGGTALRILYDLRRFSEDLDFSLVSKKDYQFSEIMTALQRSLEKQNFDVDITSKTEKTVASAFIKFNQLLYQLNLSPHKEKKISVKFEVDQHPPLGYKTELSLFNKEFLFSINHYDLPSLYASKLHAVLCRRYTKGRDYYDLLWYFGHRIEPNYLLLERAIEQTEHKKLVLDKKNLHALLENHLEKVDFSKIKKDIEPFLEDHQELRYFTKDFFVKAISA